MTLPKQKGGSHLFLCSLNTYPPIPVATQRQYVMRSFFVGPFLVCARGVISSSPPFELLFVCLPLLRWSIKIYSLVFVNFSRLFTSWMGEGECERIKPKNIYINSNFRHSVQHPVDTMNDAPRDNNAVAVKRPFRESDNGASPTIMPESKRGRL